MRVVGLDQSYTGFGYCHNGESKKKSFPTVKNQDWGNEVERLFQVEEWLTKWLEPIQPGLVVMEGYASAAKFGREMAGELGWAVKRTVTKVAEVYPLIVPPTSLKKFVTGSGGAKKAQMLLGVYKKWGVEFADDNQADAFALEKFGFAYAYHTGMWHLDPEPITLTKYEIEAIEAVKVR